MLRENALKEPAWEVATLFPPQSQWTIDDYLDLDARTNHLIEFSNGNIEVLPMPSLHHQRITRALFHFLFLFVQAHRLGEVFFSPTKVLLWPGKVREPDVFFVAKAHVARSTDQWFEKIDLVMEVVSPDDPGRDLETKRREYAQARIPEYWIIDPRTNEILVLTLGDKWYNVHGVFGAGEVAASVLLKGFTVPVDDVLPPAS
jgi:Uma2 family endonuclease